jgi:uncharacterized membrane protein YdjX (TVP38/TMEM64 family)
MEIVLTVLHSFAVAHPIGAVVSFVLLRSLCVVYPPAPGLPMDLAAIGLFGPVVGFELAETGIMIGAAIAFAAGRRARSASPMAMSRSHLLVLADRVNRSVDPEDERQQLYWWSIVRVVTNPLFDPLSYAAGLSNSRFTPFFVGTLLGNIVSMSLFFLAETYAVATSMQMVVMVTALFVATIWYVASRWLTEAGSTHLA